MPRRVREPIQVYLTEAEREALDRAARELGVSRSEVLRRGIVALRDRAGAGPWAEVEGLTPPLTGGGIPPRGTPVAPLRDLLDELAADRDAP